MSDCRTIRLSSFKTHLPYNYRLQEIVKDESTHWFLANPASQNTYLYQIELIHKYSQHHFQQSLSKLKILDWGCGKGHVTFLLGERGARVTSCDYWNDEGTDEDSSFGQKIPIIRAAGIPVQRLEHEYKLPFKDAEFDVVLSVGVLEHVQNETESLKEILRILKPNGLFFCFNLPYVFSWTQRVEHLRGHFYHDRLYSKKGAVELLQRSGFRILDLWHRQLLPKNTVRYPAYRLFESVDQSLVRFTPLKYLATNIELVAEKPA